MNYPDKFLPPRPVFPPKQVKIKGQIIHKRAYKYYVIRDEVGGDNGKDNTLITCPGQEGVGVVGKKITDNHVTDKGLADPDLLAVFPFSE